MEAQNKTADRQSSLGSSESDCRQTGSSLFESSKFYLRLIRRPQTGGFKSLLKLKVTARGATCAISLPRTLISSADGLFFLCLLPPFGGDPSTSPLPCPPRALRALSRTSRASRDSRASRASRALRAFAHAERVSAELSDRAFARFSRCSSFPLREVLL